MIQYYLLVCIPMVMSVLKKKITTKKFFDPICVFFIILIFLLSMRSVNCGADLITYKMKFETISYSSLNDVSSIFNLEYGYTLFSKLCKLLVDDFQIFISICALISIIPIMFLYKEETKNDVLTMALFLNIAPFSIFFSGLKQSIAIGIGTICFYYCKKNKIIPFIIWVVVASSFHLTALILILLYPLTHLKITSKWFILLITITAFCLVNNKQIFGWMLTLADEYESKYVISSTGSYSFLVLLIFLVIFSFIIPNEDDTNLICFRNILFFALLIQCLAPISTIAMRLNYYFLIFVPLAIPRFIDNAKPKYKQIAQISKYIFVVFFFFWFFKECYYGADILHIFPYEAFWESF